MGPCLRVGLGYRQSVVLTVEESTINYNLIIGIFVVVIIFYTIESLVVRLANIILVDYIYTHLIAKI